MIDIYLYIGSHEPVVEAIKAAGITTRKGARNFLIPYIKGNARAVYDSIGRASRGDATGSLAGTALAVKKVLEAFPEEEAVN